MRAVQKEAYDIALLDLNMGAMSGIEAARRIRAREGACGLERMPIVAMTGREEDLDECLVAGFDEIILKPMRLADVGCMLEQFLPKVCLATVQSATAH
jgi:CheY-like chemotaxis protein